MTSRPLKWKTKLWDYPWEGRRQHVAAILLAGKGIREGIELSTYPGLQPLG